MQMTYSHTLVTEKVQRKNRTSLPIACLVRAACVVATHTWLKDQVPWTRPHARHKVLSRSTPSREDPTKSRDLKNTGLVVTVPTYLLQQNSLSK